MGGLQKNTTQILMYAYVIKGCATHKKCRQRIMPHDPAQARPQTFKRPREKQKNGNENVNKINVPRIVWQKKGK